MNHRRLKSMDTSHLSFYFDAEMLCVCQKPSDISNQVLLHFHSDITGKILSLQGDWYIP